MQASKINSMRNYNWMELDHAISSCLTKNLNDQNNLSISVLAMILDNNLQRISYFSLTVEDWFDKLAFGEHMFWSGDISYKGL